ncbi:MAG: TldD/PmbA family protein [Theionarchaea archaeon]|nr:TldD/PmbA family protein [Theionarchaea archaeon]MBU7038861.1 TldD/PmbA family protein [Theionarchaea archaeon]
MGEVDRILGYAEKQGADEAEVVCEESDYAYAKFELGEPRQVFQARITEYALRVVVDHRVGFSYFTQSWKEAVEEAVALARKREKNEKWKSFAPERPGPSLNLYRESVANASIDQVMQDMKVICEAIEDPRIVASNVYCQLGHSQTEIANTSGISKKGIDSLAALRVMCRAEDGDSGMGYAHGYSLGYDFDFCDIGKHAEQQAVRQLGKVKPESGEKKVLLAPRVFANLLVCAAVPSFLGHNMEEGRSSLKIGQTVAAEHLTVRENPLVEGPQGRQFDDEGIPSRPVDLIADASVKSFIYDTYYGETTAGGIRYNRYRGRNLRDPPKPCTTSLCVTGDAAPVEELISEIRDGILVVEETNSHASKSQSGLFSIGVTSGFIIKKGEIMTPVKGCMISGLAFEDLLPRVSFVSTERELHRSFVYPTYVDTGYALVDSLRITA